MNKYELTVVLDGKSGASKKKSQTEKITKIISLFAGKILKETDLGVKDLAYKIKDSKTGLFTFFDLELDPKGVKALNDKLRTDTDVIRFLLINKAR